MGRYDHDQSELCCDRSQDVAMVTDFGANRRKLA